MIVDVICEVVCPVAGEGMTLGRSFGGVIDGFDRARRAAAAKHGETRVQARVDGIAVRIQRELAADRVSAHLDRVGAAELLLREADREGGRQTIDRVDRRDRDRRCDAQRPVFESAGRSGLGVGDLESPDAGDPQAGGVLDVDSVTVQSRELPGRTVAPGERGSRTGSVIDVSAESSNVVLMKFAPCHRRPRRGGPASRRVRSGPRRGLHRR